MRHNQNHDHGRSNGHTAGLSLQMMPVRFEYSHPTAKSVSVAGSFNDWHPDTRSMHSSGNGHWLKEMALAPGTYEYCLVVDGRWMPDPLAKRDVANPFGGRNSILEVANSAETGRPAGASNMLLKNATT
jgi:1,4-alpha-glucan branching enzyme